METPNTSPAAVTSPGVPPPAHGSRLRWDRYPDDDQNATFEAVGGTTDGESADLYYRLKQEVRCDRHVWVEDSSPELMIDEEGPLTWPTKDAAMKRMQDEHDARMRDWLDHENSISPNSGR
jgi:hypothetical protein